MPTTKDELRQIITSSTDSVLSYISSPEGQSLVRKYLECVRKRNKFRTPNYTDMIVTLGLDGCTTVDEVSFCSAFVDREVISEYLGTVFVS